MTSSHSRPAFRLHSLSACVAAILAGAAMPDARADGGNELFQTFYVTSCDDSGPGTLREAISEASSFDTISLLNLTCSTITLSSGELSADADDLTIVGYGATISAGGTSRVIAHNGAGALRLWQVTIEDGALSGVNPAYGGCVYTRGDIYLYGVTVRDCTVAPEPTPGQGVFASGGGVYARGLAWLSESSIVDNRLLPPSGWPFNYATCNGLFAGRAVELRTSVISGNSFESECGVTPYECINFHVGGVGSQGVLNVYDSTISNNTAYTIGGAAAGNYGTTSHIRNSTISGNTSTFGTGGLYSADGFLSVRNSTIAFNSSLDPRELGAGIDVRGEGEYLSLHSSIVANNTRAGISADISFMSLHAGLIVGEANLVQVSNVPLPSDTIADDPMLAPLADNGGPTRTHALLPGSPAIDAGSNLLHLTYDQRGAPRVSGPRADIGAFEVVQAKPPDEIFADGFD